MYVCVCVFLYSRLLCTCEYVVIDCDHVLDDNIDIGCFEVAAFRVLHENIFI